jgi:hypothetical protein
MYVDEKAPGEALIAPSIRTMLAWLEGRPADDFYCYSSETHCACAQFADAIGDAHGWLNRNLQTGSPWQYLNNIASLEPHTFGALAERLRSAVHLITELGGQGARGNV